ncbi:hypothetical protein CDAR_175471 [Caerostris darwini]|uniref:Uncharacterized protein n=1 Tax=Caerostris darwini TaxID=1538125 RepID=A0AAV4W158_9ARAC|nr:hypothetical protein CDAR_175471 [Caerostris darwini]
MYKQFAIGRKAFTAFSTGVFASMDFVMSVQLETISEAFTTVRTFIRFTISVGADVSSGCNYKHAICHKICTYRVSQQYENAEETQNDLSVGWVFDLYHIYVVASYISRRSTQVLR